MPHVLLYNITSPVLIFPAKTGVVYQNQTHGTLCQQDIMEGFIIPISNDYLPTNYLESIDYQLCSLFADDSHGYLDENLLNKIDGILASYPVTQGITINRNRAEESHEAWVHVYVTDTECGDYSGFNHQQAVLTWCNSD